VCTITENDVESDILRFLVRKGWIVRRQHSGIFRTQAGHPIRLGEPGMCDWSAMRPHGEERKVEYLEIEVKKPKKKPKSGQREYIAKRLHQGISATWADSLALFERWYFMEGFE